MTSALDTPGHEPSNEAAERLASFGFRVVPIAPGKKYPEGLREWQRAATNDIPTIRNWYSGLYKGHGVGITAGPGSGVWVIDIDVKGQQAGQTSLEHLVHTHGPLPPTVTVITGTGGAHLYFAWDPTRPIRNFQQGPATTHFPLGPGIDLRGDGGFVVAPPTIHPDTGKPYAWHEGRDPWSIEVATAPDWLFDLILAQPEPSAPIALPDSSPTSVGLDDSIAEWMRDQYDWPTLLHSDGWTVHSHHGPDTWWTRPGKDRRQGHSAVLHGDGALVVFTTEISPALAQAGRPTADGSGISLSIFGYVAGTRYGGDRSEAARQGRLQRQQLEGPTRASSPTSAASSSLPAPTPAALPQLPAGPSAFTELGDWWDNPQPSLTPDILTRTDGNGLLYLSQLNWIHGDSGSGKTWVLLVAAAQLIANGRHFAWCHYEDPNPAAIVGRLKLLGASRSDVVERFHYWDPQGEPLNGPALLEACKGYDVEHLGLDSVGEALNAEGINEDTDSEVGPWINRGPRHIVNNGIGVTCVDHGTKDAKNAPLHPSGSKRKRAAVTGIGLLVKAVAPPTINSDGRMEIICGKDRHGNYPQGQRVATAHLRHDITNGLIDFTLAAQDSTGGDDTEAEKRIREVIRLVEAEPGITKNQLIDSMSPAGKQRKRDAIAAAIRVGGIRVENGPRQAQELYPDD